MSDDQKWSWMEKGSEYAHGPYDTKEEALKEAEEYLNPEGEIKILIGRCNYAKPSDWVPDDLDDILEKMDECACDNEFHFCDDVIFEIDPDKKEEAHEVLVSFMKVWADKYIHSSVWNTDGEEEVTIGGK